MFAASFNSSEDTEDGGGVRAYCWCLAEVSEASDGVLSHPPVHDTWCSSDGVAAIAVRATVFDGQRLAAAVAPVR